MAWLEEVEPPTYRFEDEKPPVAMKHPNSIEYINFYRMV